jgi:phytanoyl-CoA hydroxylase
MHIFLDAQDKENGGLFCYPGSHREPILPYEYKKSWREEFDENGISHPGWKVEIPPKYKRLDVSAPKGGFLLQHGNLIHGSHPNLSKDRSRQQFSMAFLNAGEKFEQGKTSKRIPIAVEGTKTEELKERGKK